MIDLLYLALPRRPHATYPDEGTGKIAAIRPTRGKIFPEVTKFSLLCLAFNTFWARMHNRREEMGITHFGMQHDDIVPEAGWADVQCGEMERSGADIVSAVVPLKDKRRLTTTGIRNIKTGDLRRVTMKEALRLPETFDLDDMIAAGIDLPGDRIDKVMMINTGLWLCRLDRPWVDRFPGFRMLDEVRKRPDGKREAVCMPEDWLWSEWLGTRGIRVVATRKTPLGHFFDAGTEYRNDETGEGWETDLGDDPKV